MRPIACLRWVWWLSRFVFSPRNCTPYTLYHLVNSLQGPCFRSEKQTPIPTIPTEPTEPISLRRQSVSRRRSAVTKRHRLPRARRDQGPVAFGGFRWIPKALSVLRTYAHARGVRVSQSTETHQTHRIEGGQS